MALTYGYCTRCCQTTSYRYKPGDMSLCPRCGCLTLIPQDDGVRLWTEREKQNGYRVNPENEQRRRESAESEA